MKKYITLQRFNKAIDCITFLKSKENAKTAGVNYLVAEIEGYSMPVEESVEVSLDYLLDAPFVKSSYAK